MKPRCGSARESGDCFGRSASSQGLRFSLHECQDARLSAGATRHGRGEALLGMTTQQGSIRLPRGQVLTEKWPVLTYGETPRVDLERWTFRCLGLVEEPVSWSWKEFLALPRVRITSDIHCVTRWSRFDNR